MMKIEIEKDFPQYFKPAYPEEFELFSHFEVTAGIPTVLFAITTWKENGKPNVCFHSWSCFHGDKTAFFAVMGNLYQHTHTYANIQREKCFCINFLPISCYDRLVNTIHQNEWYDDEFAAGGFTVSNAKAIHAPAISEAFLTMECTLKEIQDLSGAGITAMVIGQVQHISVEEAYAQGYELDGYTDFIFLNRFGQPQHQATLNKAIRRIIRDCNDEQFLKDENAKVLLPHFSCHSLRHTFTTRMCEAGVNVKVIQDTLGHKDISTTLNIYTDVTKELRRSEFEGLDSYFKNEYNKANEVL